MVRLKRLIEIEQYLTSRKIESIFMSLGAYRDHLLGETLRQAYKNAKIPEKLFVGAVV